MMEGIAFGITTALTQGVSGSVTVSDENPGFLSEITLHQRSSRGVASRSFSVLHNPAYNGYGRSYNNEAWTANFPDDMAAALDTLITSELLTPDEQGVIIDADTTNDLCPDDLDKTLGESQENKSASGVLSSVVGGPTAEVIARRALSLIGVSLVILDGPGIYQKSRYIKRYRSLLKTVGQVLDDTILISQPRTWFADGTLFVDGRAFSTAPSPMFQHATDHAYDRVDGLIPWEQTVEGRTREERACPENFETNLNGSHSWHEYTGEGDDAQVIYYTIRKEHGNVVFESESRYGYVSTLTGLKWSHVYKVVKRHRYLSGCPGALIFSRETISEARTDFTYWNVTIAPGAAFGKVQEIRDWVPPLYVVSQKIVTQRYHSEGWLRARTEQNYEAAGVIQTIFGTLAGDIVYRKTTRTEEYTPVGKGQWWIRVTEMIPSERPVYEQQFQKGVYEITATYPISRINSYSRPTDGSPPQVSCGGDEDIAKEDPKGLYNAQRANDPDRLVHALTFTGLRFEFSVGQFLGGCYITSVNWSLGENSATTEVGLWQPL